jgi:hypothetical protein
MPECIKFDEIIRVENEANDNRRNDDDEKHKSVNTYNHCGN